MHPPLPSQTQSPKHMSVPTQTPPEHWSGELQLRPSSQAAPSVLREQEPVSVRGVPPAQLPLEHA